MRKRRLLSAHRNKTVFVETIEVRIVSSITALSSRSHQFREQRPQWVGNRGVGQGTRRGGIRARDGSWLVNGTRRSLLR